MFHSSTTATITLTPSTTTSQVKMQFNPQQIATKGFSTDFVFQDGVHDGAGTY